jgi:hypothetical protein
LVGNLVGTGDAESGRSSGKQRTQALSVHGRDIGEQQTDRKFVVTALRQRRNHLLSGSIFVQRQDHTACGVNAFGHLEAVPQSNRWFRCGIVQVTDVATVVSPQKWNVANSTLGDERDARPLRSRIALVAPVEPRIRSAMRSGAISGAPSAASADIRTRCRAGNLGNRHPFSIDGSQI